MKRAGEALEEPAVSKARMEQDEPNHEEGVGPEATRRVGRQFCLCKEMPTTRVSTKQWELVTNHCLLPVHVCLCGWVGLL